MAGGSTQFVFVNEDDISLPSRVRPTDRKVINSHVQHRAHHQRHVAGLMRLKQTVKFRRPGLHSEPRSKIKICNLHQERSLVAPNSLLTNDSLGQPLPRNECAVAERRDGNEHLKQRHKNSSWLKIELFTNAMSRGCPPRLSCQIGGLRVDPFNMYPIESKGCVPSAIDYFIKVFAPLAIRAPEDRAVTRKKAIFPAYFRMLLHDAMFFEQMVVFCEVLQLVHKGFEVRLSQELMYRLNNVHVQLGERLQTAGDSTSDAVIMTILSLVCVNNMMRNLQAFTIHAEGLRRIVALRGGIENLGWNGYLRSRILQLEASLSARDQKPQQRLIYPNHPFSPSLCQTISKLPVGFRKLARTEMLSFLVIDFVEQLGRRLQDDTRTKVVSSCMTAYQMLIDVPELSAIERWIVSTLLSFCIAIDGIVRGRGFANPIHTLRVNGQVMLLVRDSHATSCDPDFLAWAAFVLRVTTEPGTEPWQWAAKFIGSVSMKGRTERELEQIFWPIPKYV